MKVACQQESLFLPPFLPPSLSPRRVCVRMFLCVIGLVCTTVLLWRLEDNFPGLAPQLSTWFETAQSRLQACKFLLILPALSLTSLHRTPGSQMYVLKCPAFTWVLGSKSGSLGLLDKFLFTPEPSPQSRQYSFYHIENGKNSSDAYTISNKYFKRQR